MKREVGIYKIEKEKRVRVKVRTGPWYGISMGGTTCVASSAFSALLFFAAVFFAGNNERNELEYNNPKTYLSNESCCKNTVRLGVNLGVFGDRFDWNMQRSRKERWNNGNIMGTKCRKNGGCSLQSVLHM